jgi:hypothetical protein
MKIFKTYVIINVYYKKSRDDKRTVKSKDSFNILFIILGFYRSRQIFS